jgi:hypothetical protein
VTPEPLRGRAYGLRQALDTVGAFLGPLAALAAMAVFADNIRTVFWLVVLPGVPSLFWHGTSRNHSCRSCSWTENLGRPFWWSIYGSSSALSG